MNARAPNTNTSAYVRTYISDLDPFRTPGVFYTYFYNHARRFRLEKLLYLRYGWVGPILPEKCTRPRGGLGKYSRCFQVGKVSRKVRCGKIGRRRRPISAARGNM
jgi:hypothetical protein